MSVWAYDRGEWKAMPNPFAEGEELEKELKEIGFERKPMLSWGDEHGFYVEVHAPDGVAGVNVGGFADTEVEAEFYVAISTPSRIYSVFVADLPSLVQLVGELRPILVSESEALDFEERNK
jgi:hypothetical protein